MRFLPSFTLIGFDLFSFLRNRNSKPKSLFSGVSILQTFRSFIEGIGDQKKYEEEEELLEAGRLLATHIGEKEIISTVSGFMPQNIADEIISPSNSQASTKTKVTPVSDILEIPSTVFDIFSSKQ